MIKYLKLNEHWGIEICLFNSWSWKYGLTLFNCDVSFSYNGDHSGFFSCLVLFNVVCELNIYDNRHYGDE